MPWRTLVQLLLGFSNFSCWKHLQVDVIVLWECFKWTKCSKTYYASHQITCFQPKKTNTFKSLYIGLNSRTIHHVNNNVESACLCSCIFGFKYYKSWFVFFWCWLLQVVCYIPYVGTGQEKCFKFCRNSKVVRTDGYQCFCGSYSGDYFSGLLFIEEVNSSECNLDCSGDPELKCRGLTQDYYSTRTSTLISLYYRQGKYPKYSDQGPNHVYVNIEIEYFISILTYLYASIVPLKNPTPCINLKCIQ